MNYSQRFASFTWCVLATAGLTHGASDTQMQIALQQARDHISRGEDVEAIKCLRTCLTAAQTTPDRVAPPDHRSCLWMLSQCHGRLNEHHQAIQFGEEYYRLCRHRRSKIPDTFWPFELHLARSLTAIGEYPRAEDYLSRAGELLKLDPHGALAFEYHVRKAKLAQLRRLGPMPDAAAPATHAASLAAGSQPNGLDDTKFGDLWRAADDCFEHWFLTRSRLNLETEVGLIPVVADAADVQPDRAQRWLRRMAEDLLARSAYRESATACVRLAALCQTNAQYSTACQHYQKALWCLQTARQGQPPDTFELFCGILVLDVALAELQNHPGNASLREQLQEIAIKVHRSADQAADSTPQSPRLALWQRLTATYFLIGDGQRAELCANELLTLSAQHDDSPHAFGTWARTALGEIHWARGQLSKARESLEHARERLIDRPEISPDQLATVLSLLAAFSVTGGNYEQARKYLQEELEHRRRFSLDDAYHQAKVFDLFGTTWARTDRFQQAIEAYTKADALCSRELGRDVTLAAVRTRLMRLRLHVLLNLARVHQSQITPRNLERANGLYDSANEVLTHLRAESTDQRMVAFQVRLLQALTDLSVRFAEHQDALDHLATAKSYAKESLRLCKLHPQLSPLAIESQEDLAFIARRLGEPGAERQWQELLAGLSRQPNTELRQARACSNLAECAYRQQRFDEARDRCREAQRLLAAYVGSTGESAPPLAVFNAAVGQGKACVRLGRWDEAARCLERGLSAVEPSRSSTVGELTDRADFFKHFAPAGELLVESYLTLGQHDKAMIAAELVRNRVLQDQLKDQLDPVHQDTYQHFIQLNRASVVEGLRKNVLRDRGLLLYYFLGSDKSWLFVVGGRGPLQYYRLEITPEALDAIRTWAPNAASSLSAGPLTRMAAARLVDMIYDQMLQRPGKATQGDRKKGRGINLARDDTDPLQFLGSRRTTSAEASVTLTDVLIPRELRTQIEKGGYEQVIIVPDGALHRLPFEALVCDPDGKQFILDAFPPTSYAPSASALALLVNRPFPGEARLRRFELLALGNNSAAPGQAAAARTQYDAASVTRSERHDRWETVGDDLARLPALQFSELEAQAAHDTMKRSHVRVGRQASEYDLRHRLRHCRTLHFAGHAVVSPRQDGQSFLVLAQPTSGQPSSENDGLLFDFEIPQLDLTGCELVVLSACETNRGPAIELETDNSLARAFLVYGSQRVIASQWRVDDASTARLMARFYEEVRHDRDHRDMVRYARALQTARRHVRSTWQHPYYWAPFVLIGAPQ